MPFNPSPRIRNKRAKREGEPLAVAGRKCPASRVDRIPDVDGPERFLASAATPNLLPSMLSFGKFVLADDVKLRDRPEASFRPQRSGV